MYQHRVCSNYPYIAPSIHSTKELLKMQTSGKFLTHEEKLRVKKYAQEKRKQRLCN